jgi:hypothetical protein
MSEPSEPPTTAAGAQEPLVDDPQPFSVGRRLGRILALGVLVAIAALWAFVLWGPVQRVPQGRLDSRAFPEAAEPICSEAASAIDELPPAFETREAQARADVVVEANGYLAVMLDRLDAIAPAPIDGDDGRMINEWLGDWRTFLGDRERYAQALETDPGARMLVTEKERRQVSEPIDYFAKTNFMPNCATPGDLA